MSALKNLLFILLLFLFLSPITLAVLSSGSINIFAVTEDGEGMSADLLIYTIPGTGKTAFITSSSLVGKDTQTTGNIALQIAQKKTGVVVNDKDFIFDIRANASEVDGPSAGAAMALLAYSMFAEKQLPIDVAVTGTINNDGSIGMVGGVGAKAEAASKTGIKLFLIPTGEAVTDIRVDGKYKTVNLLEYGPKELNMKIVEVSNIDTAIKYAYSNINDILVDSNVSLNIFIPQSIKFNESLLPMKKISENYIEEARIAIDEAKDALEKSSLPDSILADFYQKYGSTNRTLEMSQRFLDQNYLYSAANYAFNARVLASTIKEIAQNPSLLSSDSMLLDTKISSLSKEISLLKQRIDFIPLDGVEWTIGAQQRIAYAEDALNGIKNTVVVKIDSEGSGTDAQKEIQFNKVYDYVSAVAWTSVASDFVKQAQKSELKKTPFYSEEFVFLVRNKVSSSGKMIADSNVSDSTKEEALRRYNAAVISFDNNFFFAALYDSYFAEAFISSEIERNGLTDEALLAYVKNTLDSGSLTNSVWSNMFFDHAKFYYENALFNKKLSREEDVRLSLETSFDLLYLSKKLSDAYSTVGEYISSAPLEDYSSSEPIVDIKYNRITDSTQYLIVLVLMLAILLLALILLIGLLSRSKRSSLAYDGREQKLRLVLHNLDRALMRKRISDAEYFFIKKKYEDELSRHSVLRNHKKNFLSLDELRSKQKALERGLVDLKRHYREGLIIPEDYERQAKQVESEVDEVIEDIKLVQKETRESKSKKVPHISILSRIFSREEKVKGTEELVGEEEKQEKKEKEKRRRLLKRFASEK